VRVESVTSAQNRKVKTLLALQEKARLRKEMGLFVVEGRRELEHCIRAGFEIDTLFICPEIAGCAVSQAADGSPAEAIRYSALKRNADPTRVKASTGLPSADIFETASTGSAVSFGGSGDTPVKAIHVGALSRTADPIRAKSSPGVSPAPFVEPALLAILEAAGQIVEVPKELYAKIAYREGTEGMVAEVKVRERTLERLRLKENPLVVVLEGVEKPGNLGAVLRSADAAGADAVLVCDPLTDLYNPNLIRASIGAVFTVPVACCSSEEAIKWLKDNDINIYTAQLQDSSWYYDTDMTEGTAIVIGTEATGLTDAWRRAADAHIRIPMLGELDSLNASVSAAILLFEAVRQRNA